MSQVERLRTCSSSIVPPLVAFGVLLTVYEPVVVDAILFALGVTASWPSWYAYIPLVYTGDGM